jgi:Glyoxalase-like domain
MAMDPEAGGDLNLEFSMTVRIASVTFDCADALTVGRFWSAALDRPLDPNASSDYASIGFAGRRDTVGWAPVEGDNDPTWMFSKVPEPKTAKNRMHLDLMSPDPEAEVVHLIELGATRVADMNEYGYEWTVMADPEGNEFCVAKAR